MSRDYFVDDAQAETPRSPSPPAPTHARTLGTHTVKLFERHYTSFGSRFRAMSTTALGRPLSTSKAQKTIWADERRLGQRPSPDRPDVSATDPNPCGPCWREQPLSQLRPSSQSS